MFMASYENEIIARDDDICGGSFDRVFRNQIGLFVAAS